MQYPKDWTYELSQKGVCGILAVAISAGVSYKQANEACKKNMMPWQKRHRGGTFTEQRMGALKTLGKRFVEIVPEQRRNVRTTIRELCRSDRTYVLTTAQHVLVYRNGELADQGLIDHYESHPGKRQFVKHIVEVL